MSLQDNRFVSILENAKETRVAAAAFNIVNEQSLRGVLRAAESEGRPIIIQTSTSTVKRLGAEALGGMVNSARNQVKIPFALHLDHCRDDELVKECIRFGWDSIMMDYSHLDLSENIVKMKQIVAYAHQYGIAVEGEVGLIKGVEDDIQVDSEKLATLEDTVYFVDETGVDAIAPAIGTAHGQYTKKPSLNFDLVQKLSAFSTPVVVHGGTGLEDGVFLRLVDCGAAKINISTAVKASYLEGMKTAILSGKKNPLACDEIIEEEIQKMAAGLIRLFARKDV